MEKSVMWLLIGIGSIIGGLIPTWFGASYFSLWGIVGSTIGAFAGLYLFRRLSI